MGTLIKYLIYIALIVAAFFILNGLWEGDLTRDSTMRDVGNEVSSGVSNAAQKASDAVQGN